MSAEFKELVEEAVDLIQREHGKAADNIYADGEKIAAARLPIDEKRLVARRMHWEYDIDAQDLCYLFRVSPMVIEDWIEWGTMAIYCRCGRVANLTFKDRRAYKESGVGGIVCETCNRKAYQEEIEAKKAVAWAKRLAELKAMPYEEYLQTPEWKARRDERVRMDGGACRLCGSRENLNVHHRTYERLGEESPLDLVTLCYGCHQTFHENRRLCNGPAPPGSTADVEATGPEGS